MNLTDCDDCEELKHEMKYSTYFQVTSWHPEKRKRHVYSDDSSSGPVNKKLYRKSPFWKPEQPKKPKGHKGAAKGPTMYDSCSPYHHHLFHHAFNLCEEAQRLRISFCHFKEILCFDTEHLSKDDMSYVMNQRSESSLFSTNKDEF